MRKLLICLLPLLISLVSVAQPTAGAISVTGGSGTGGAFIVGDIVTAQWDNNVDGATGVSAVTFDFSEFGGGAAVVANDIGGEVYEATYSIAAPGTTETTTADVTVTVVATTGGGMATGTDDHTVDDVLPNITTVVPNILLITDGDVGTGTFTITVAFDEPMIDDGSQDPAITFDNEDPSTTLTLNGVSWLDNQTYEVTYDVADAGVNLADVDVLVSGGQDVNGNGISATNTNQDDLFSIDTENPSITTVTPNLVLIADGDVGTGTFTITVAFDEPMIDDGSQDPAITFDNEDPSTTLTLNGVSWPDNQTYEVTYDVADAGVNLADVDVLVSGGQDVNGNGISATNTNQDDLFSIDTENPSITTVTPSPVLISDGDVGVGTFTITVAFDEPMIDDGSQDPAITFDNEDPSTTLTLNGVSWPDNQTFEVAYDVADAGVNLADVDVLVSGGQDANGNAITATNTNQDDLFDIDTENPSLTLVTFSPSTGILGIGNSLTVTVTAGGSETSLSANTALVNGIDVSGSLFDNGDGTYDFTYTVSTTDTDRAAGTIPVSFILADGGGNTSNNITTVAANTTGVDATEPSITSVTPNLVLISDGDVGVGTFTITVAFDEPMIDDGSQDPTLTFDNEDPSTTLTLNGVSWPDNQTYEVTYDVADAGVNLADVDVLVSGGQDVNGNGISTTNTNQDDLFSIDTENPSITTVTPSPVLISDGDVGVGTFTITVAFDEPMIDDGSQDPAITFDNEDPSITLTLNGVSWPDNQTFEVAYDVADAGVNLADVDVLVSGGQDANGNAITATNTNQDDLFDIDTENPTFVDATYYDTDQDGSVDEILLEFSEDIDEASVSDTDFNIGSAGYGTVAFSVVATPANNGVDLNDTDNFITLGVNTGTTADQTVEYTQGGLTDEAGNLAATNLAISTIDLAVPVLTDVQIEDTDDDALIDRVVYVFSEVISDADDDDTYFVADIGTITLPDGQAAVFGDGDISVSNDGTYGYVEIDNISGQVTENTSIGSLAVSGVNGSWDDDQGQTSIGDASENYIDAASPVILSTSITSNAYADINFSEGVYGNAAATLPVDDTDFTIDIDGTVTGEAIVSVKNTTAVESDDVVNVLVGGESTVRVFFSFNQPNAGGETVTFDTDGSLYDDSNNAAAITQFPPDNQDVLVAPDIPDLTIARWLDEDGDGDIDAVEYTFNIDWDIDEGGSNDSNDPLDCFEIRNNGVLVTQDNFDYDSETTNGFYAAGAFAKIYFDGDQQPGTSIENLTLEYVTGVDDRIESQSTEDDAIPGDTPETYLDGAAPLFSGFTATILDTDVDGNVDQIQVDTEDHIDDTAINPAEFTYNGVAAVGVANVDNTDKSFYLVVNGNGTAVEGDFVYTVGTLVDTAANASDGGTILAASITDGAGPVILDALTADNDLNGQIDEITVTFSEAFDDLGIDDLDFSLSDGYTIPVAGFSVSSPDVILTVTESGASDTYITPDVTVVADILEDQSAPDGANNPAQTFTNTSDGAAPLTSVTPATQGSVPDLSGAVDDPTASILINVSGGSPAESYTRSAVNDGLGGWTFTNTGSAPGGFTLGSIGTYEVTVIAIDQSGNTGFDNTNNELTISGGATITAATPGNICEADGFVPLGQIRIQESADNDFGSDGGILLTLPEGFEFNIAATPDFSASSLNDFTVSGTYIGTASFRINIETPFTTSGSDDLRIDGLEVKVVTGGSSGVLERTGGSAGLLTTDTDYAVLTSTASPSPITSVDVGGSPYTQEYSASYVPATTVPYLIQSLAFVNGETVTFGGNSSGTGVIINGTITGSSFEIYPSEGANIVNGGSISGGTSGATATVNGAISQGTSTLDPFTLTVNPGADDAIWLDGSGGNIDLTAGGSDPQQTTGTNTELSATSPGLYTYDISVDDGGICASEVLRFNILIYDDIDGAPIGSNTFTDRNFITTQEKDTIFVTQPTNHTVTVTGTGVSGQFQSDNNPSSEYKQYFFDPGLAGEGNHIISFTTTNNITGESVTLQATFSVTLPIDFFEEISLPDNLCASDLPYALTVDKTAFQPGQDLDYVYFINQTTGSPNGGRYWYAFNNEFPGYTGDPNTSVYEFEFDFRSSYVAATPALDWDKFTQSHELANGDAYAFLVYRTLRTPFVQPVDNIFVYGAPIVEVSNVSEAYCSDDEAFTIQRTATYVSGFTEQNPGNEFTYWIPNRVENEVADITTGYELWTESTPGSGVYDVLVVDFTEVGQGVGNEVNTFDPSDPDQSGTFNASEAQNYRIIYTSEPLSGAGCEGQAFFDVTVDAPDSAPTLDGTTLVGGFSTGFNNNASPDDGVDADEYVLEYCVGDVLADFTASDISTYGFNSILSGTITFPAGPVFQAGETVIGRTTGVKGAVISVTPTSVFVTSVTGDFREGEIIDGTISLASGTVSSFVESELSETEVVQGQSSGQIATITSIGTNGFVLSGQSGPFINNEIMVGLSSQDRVRLIGAGEVSWYDESFNRINGFENRYTIASSALGLNVNASNELTAEESQTFYFTRSSIYGCESDFRKVVVNVFSEPAVPNLDISGWPTAVKVGDVYTLDYCVEDGGASTTPNPLLLDDLDPDESYNITREFRDFSAGPPAIIANATITESGGDTNPESITVPDIFAGDTIIYTITKTENISLEAYNNFPGCTGDPITVRIVAQEEASVPTELDFDAGTLTFHICEGETLPNITHTFANGTDEYIWYEGIDGGNNGVTRIGSPLELNDPMEASILESASTFPADFTDFPNTYTAYVSRNNDIIDSRGFDGCESEAVPVTITVHAQQPAVGIVSDNSFYGVPNFTDQDANMTDDIYNFAICSDQLLPNMEFDATNIYAGDERVEWYRESDGFLLYVGESPTFNNLGLVGASSGQITFEVVQVTDTLTDAYGVYFDGCPSEVATLIIDVSDPESLEIVDDMGDALGTVYCRDDDPLGDMSGNLIVELEVASVTADPADVSYQIDSYLESDFDAGNPADQSTGIVSSGSFPVINLASYHDAVTGSQIVGGEPTVHVITMIYFDDNTLCETSISEAIYIHPDPNVSFTFDGINANMLEFCYDDPIIKLVGLELDGNALNGTGSFSINTAGVTPTGNNSADFVPSQAHDNVYSGLPAQDRPFAAQSMHTINYNYTDQLGCEQDTTLIVLVNPRPQIVSGNIQSANSCALENLQLFVEMGDALSYTFDWSVNGALIDNSTTELTDQDGNVNDEFLEYDLQGQTSANFSVVVTNTITGCQVSRLNQAITVGEAPDPKVTWVGSTVGRTTEFLITEDNDGLVDSNVDSLGIRIDGVQVLTEENPAAINFPYTYNEVFNVAGIHTIEVGMRTTAGCRIPMPSRNVVILDHLPGITSYTEDFESGDGGWSIETLSLDGKSNTLTTSWEIGTNVPDSASGTTYDGTNAVYTNGYQSSEVSFVYSPSFDLTAFSAPTISFLRYEDFETFRDGVVFQMSVDDGRTWVNVGGFDDAQPEGLKSTPNWYNREAITSAPGTVSPGPQSTANNAQGIGWAENSDWKEAIAPLAIPAGQEQYVRFRFALAAQATPKTTNGFAFDLVQIYDREQVVLVEQFSSTLSQDSYNINGLMDAAPIFNGNDILRINYFTDFANSGNFKDELNQRNTSAPGARSSYYGIEDIPSISISGDAQLISNASQLSGSIAAQLTNAKLVNPGFDISINASIDAENVLTVGADFTAISELPRADTKLGLFLAILEPEILVDNTMGPIGLYQVGDAITNVLRKMLPSAAGQFEQGAVAINDVLTIEDMTWPVSNMYVMDTLTIVAYVQDLSSKQVLQSAVLGLSNPNTELALGLSELTDFSLYPNPADKEVTVEFADMLREKTEWVIFDQAGREVLKGQLDKGTKTMTVQTSEMPSGLYFIHLFAEDRKRQSKRIMVIH